MSTRLTQQIRRYEPAIGIGGYSFVSLCLLLVLPVCALSRLATRIDWRLLAALPMAFSLFTYLAYRSDKLRAQTGAWRVSERKLHLAELAGGWPGAFLAQRRFRHKISKTSYQFAFWIIVTSHQFLAMDFLLEWRFTKHALQLIKSQAI